MKLDKLEEKKKQRIKFVKYWADYIKTHDDKKWSKQQNIIIDSQLSGRE